MIFATDCRQPDALQPERHTRQLSFVACISSVEFFEMISALKLKTELLPCTAAFSSDGQVSIKDTLKCFASNIKKSRADLPGLTS